MNDLISRCELFNQLATVQTLGEAYAVIQGMRTFEIIRCKDCKHQKKYWHEDRRMKDKGYFVYSCDLNEDYSHVCLDEDYCSRAERKDDETNNI